MRPAGNVGESYPAFQHKSNIGSVTPPGLNNVIPVVHPENGLQNMTAAHCPGSLAQQGYANSHLHGLPHQLGSQTRILSTGFKQPEPGYNMCSPPNGHNKSDRQSECNLGQQKECCKQNSSDMNVNNGLQQRRDLNLALRSSSEYVAPTVPSQDQLSPVPRRKHHGSSPLLHFSLKQNLSDPHFTAQTFLSKKTDIELNAGINCLDKSHSKSEQVKSPPPDQNISHSGGMPRLQQVFSLADGFQQSTDRQLLSVGGTVLLTDDQIKELIEEKVARFRTVLARKSQKTDDTCSSTGRKDSTLQGDGTLPKSISVAHVSTTSASDEDDFGRQSVNCATAERRTVAVGQILEEDSSISTSEKHSIEYQHIMSKAAATCSQNEDESPVVLTKESGITLNEQTEKHPSSMVNCSSSQEEYESLRLNVNKNKMPGVSWALKRVTGRNKGDAIPAKAAGLDNATDAPKDLQITSFERTSLGDNANAKKDGPSRQREGEDVLSVKDLKDPKYEDISDDEGVPPLAKTPLITEREKSSFPCLKDPQYDDISENEDVGVEKPSLAQVPEPNKRSQFENESFRVETEMISDEEPMPEKQVSPETKGLDMAHCFCPHIFVSDNGCDGPLCPFSERDQQENNFVSCSPLSVFKSNETDDDDYIVVPITMSELRFEPEGEVQHRPEENPLSDGENGEKESPPLKLHRQAPAPASASFSSQIEVFDTVESFLQAKLAQFKNRFGLTSSSSSSDYGLPSEGDPQTSQRGRESYADSSETEDSCDYSSDSEHNFLTLSRQFWKNRAAHLHPQTTESVWVTQSEGDEVSVVQTGQTESFEKMSCVKNNQQLVEAKPACNDAQHESSGQKTSKDVLIIPDCETGGESDQKGQQKAKRRNVIVTESDTQEDSQHSYQMTNLKRSSPSGSVDGGDSPCVPQKRYLPETVDNESGTGVHMHGNGKTHAPKTLTGSSKKSDCSEKTTQHLYKNKKVRFMSKAKDNDIEPATKNTVNTVEAEVQKVRRISRTLSSPASLSCSSSVNGQLSEARRSSATFTGSFQSSETSSCSSHLKSKRSASFPSPACSSSKPRLPHAHPKTFISRNISTKDPLSVKKQVIEHWKKSFFPTRTERRGNTDLQDDLKTTNQRSFRKAKPGPSRCDRTHRRSHSVSEFATPLMKKTVSDAIQWTKAINRFTPRKQRHSVNDGYKWSEKPRKGDPTKY